MDELDFTKHETDGLHSARDMPSTFHFDRLTDPMNDRVMKEVPLPPNRPLSLTQVYPQYI